LTPAQPDRGVGLDPDPDADPDADGVALAAVTAVGVLLGTRFAMAVGWVVEARGRAMACLATGRPSRLRAGAGTGAAAGLLVLGALLAAGAAAASVRATVVRGGMLVGRVGQPGRVEVTGIVAEEPRRLRRGGGHWVVLTVDHLRVGGQTFRTRERAGVVLTTQAFASQALAPQTRPAGDAGAEPAGRNRAATGRSGRDVGPELDGASKASTRILGDDGAQRGGFGDGSTGRLGADDQAGASASGPARSDRVGGDDGRLAVGDLLRVRASVGAARWADRLGRRPTVVLRHPVVEGRAPPAGAALRVSEAVRDAARSRASASLSEERAGLLVGMALGDTSLLPPDLERDFRAAGLTHLMAVSGANLAVVLAAGLLLAGILGAGRGSMAAVGIVLVVLLVVVTRWEPSVLRAGVMAGLVMLGVATGRGPGGRRALCLAVIVLLLADPSLAGALGFQLSVAATTGVLWLGPVVARAFPGWVPERVGKAVGITLGAQATAVPALALALGPVSLAGLPANLVGIPLAGGPMLLGVVAAAAAPVAPWAATVACRLADPFLLALIAVARWAAALPGGSVNLTGPARAVPAGTVVLVMMAAALRRRSPYLSSPTRGLSIDLERTAPGGDDHRGPAPPGGVVAARDRGARDLGPPDLSGPGQAVRHPLR
jgi:ComEC/Rec2-related protein